MDYVGSMQRALFQFVRGSFSAGQFRRWVRHLPDNGEDLVQHLPGAEVDDLKLFDDGATLLVQHGLGAAIFDALAREFPLKVGQIKVLADLCGVVWEPAWYLPPPGYGRWLVLALAVGAGLLGVCVVQGFVGGSAPVAAAPDGLQDLRTAPVAVPTSGVQTPATQTQAPVLPREIPIKIPRPAGDTGRRVAAPEPPKILTPVPGAKLDPATVRRDIAAKIGPEVRRCWTCADCIDEPHTISVFRKGDRIDVSPTPKETSRWRRCVYDAAKAVLRAADLGEQTSVELRVNSDGAT